MCLTDERGQNDSYAQWESREQWTSKKGGDTTPGEYLAAQKRQM